QVEDVSDQVEEQVEDVSDQVEDAAN
ncbi:MAG: hypothetical protein ACI8UR_002495, partial [Natronomonas sp.]